MMDPRVTQYKNRVDATVDSANRVASLCVRSGTVRRLIYTASVMAASPLKDGRSTYKEYIDETCWTPADLSIPYTSDYVEVTHLLLVNSLEHTKTGRSIIWTSNNDIIH